MHFKKQKAGMDDDVADWSCTDVDRWLSQNGFQQYVDLLCYQHKIDGQVISLRQVIVYYRPQGRGNVFSCQSFCPLGGVMLLPVWLSVCVGGR